MFSAEPVIIITSFKITVPAVAIVNVVLVSVLFKSESLIVVLPACKTKECVFPEILLLPAVNL